MDVRFSDEDIRRLRASYRRPRFPLPRIPGPPHLLKREVFVLAVFVAGLCAVIVMRYVLPLFGLITWPDA